MDKVALGQAFLPILVFLCQYLSTNVTSSYVSTTVIQIILATDSTKIETMRPFRRPTLRYDNIKTGYIYLAHDRIQCWCVVNMVMKLRIP